MTTYRIAAKTQLTERIAALTLTPVNGAVPDWSAGAHGEVDLGDLGTRSYSLIRWPEQLADHVHIAVQREPEGKGGSRAMHRLEVGAEVALSEVKNSFALQDTAKPIALIAGGIGVTPLISMASALARQGKPFTFHYTGRSAASMAYLDELNRVFPSQLTCYFDDTAPIDLAATLASLSDHAFYICGPKGMIDAARFALEANGVPSSDIHVELFATPEPSDDASTFEVELASTGDIVTVKPDQSIIEALEAAGHDVMYDCQRGDCGICQVDVLAGTPDHRDVVLSEAEKASGAVMQICVSRATSARLVLDI